MSLGPWQVLLILMMILIFYGAGRLLKVMGDLGKGIKNLKNSLKELDKDETNT